MTAHHQIEERVSSLEASVAALADNINKFMTSTERSLGEISRIVHAGGRTPWGVVFAGVGLGVALLGSAGAALLAPAHIRLQIAERDLERLEKSGVKELDRVERTVAARAEKMDARLDRNRESIHESDRRAESLASSLRDKLSEVETQFGWIVDAVNQDRAHRIRMEGLLYAKSFGEPLPLLHINPIGPRRAVKSQEE